MSAPKFTPGPWRLLPEECDKSYIRIRGTQLGGRYKIANVLTPVYEGAHEREAEETRANARLIAAAPELFEALLAYVQYTDAGIETGEADRGEIELAEKARAALAKATGEQS